MHLIVKRSQVLIPVALCGMLLIVPSLALAQDSPQVQDATQMMKVPHGPTPKDAQIDQIRQSAAASQRVMQVCSAKVTDDRVVATPEQRRNAGNIAEIGRAHV